MKKVKWGQNMSPRHPNQKGGMHRIVKRVGIRESNPTGFEPVMMLHQNRSNTVPGLTFRDFDEPSLSSLRPGISCYP